MYIYKNTNTCNLTNKFKQCLTSFGLNPFNGYKRDTSTFPTFYSKVPSTFSITEFTIPTELLFNPFVPNAPFLYPLKTSENLKVF